MCNCACWVWCGPVMNYSEFALIQIFCEDQLVKSTLTKLLCRPKNEELGIFKNVKTVADFMCNSWISRRKLIKLANRIYDIKRAPRAFETGKRQNISHESNREQFFLNYFLDQIFYSKMKMENTRPQPIQFSIYQFSNKKVQRLPMMNHYCLVKVKLNTLWTVPRRLTRENEIRGSMNIG